MRLFFYFSALLLTILVNLSLIFSPTMLIPFLILEGVAISALLANEAAECLMPVINGGPRAPTKGMVSFATACGLMVCCASSLVLAGLALSSIVQFMLPTLVIIGSVVIGERYARALNVCCYAKKFENADRQCSLPVPEKKRCPITGKTAEDASIKQCPKLGPISPEELHNCAKYLENSRLSKAQKVDNENTTETATSTPAENVQQNTEALKEKPKTATMQTNAKQAQNTENQQLNTVTV